MALPEVHGHHEVRTLLARSARADALPQSILIHGPAGVGKERLALWIASLLVCEEEDAPCGRCTACIRSGKLEYPDIHWFFPLPRPESTSPEKLRDRLEEMRGSELQLWRENPYRVQEWEKAPAHFLQSIRTIQQLASMRPSTGTRKVFVVGDAELMVPQEATQEAANAFLKLLEEPPTETTFILTTSQPGALLPTIMSRVLSVRVGIVPEDDIRRLLEGSGKVKADDALKIARRANGSVRRALMLAGGGGVDAEREAGRAMLLAALSDGPVARLGLAHDRKPTGARAEFTTELDAFAEWLRDLLAVASGATDRVSGIDAVPILKRAVDQRHIPTTGIMTAIDRVSAARDLAYRNVNPQLILADLIRHVQRDLGPGAASQ
jgi:DNA polymerase III subunit delta'